MLRAYLTGHGLVSKNNALFKMNNCKIFNVQVDDRLRYSGVSKYSFNNRFWIGIIDLIKVYILIKKGERNGD